MMYAVAITAFTNALVTERNLRVLSDWGRQSQAAPALTSAIGGFRSRGLLASLRGRRKGRRMMGSEEQNVSICFTTLPACARRLRTLNEIALPIVPTGTTPSAHADSNSWSFAFPFMRSRRSTSGRQRQRRFLFRTGTRRRRSTSDGGWSQACGRPRHGLSPCRDAWRSSCPRPAGSTICGSARANYEQLRRGRYARVRRRIG